MAANNQDMFGRSTLFGGAMSADATKLTFSDNETTGMIIQQVNITYSQNVTRLYALEDGRCYFVAGRTDGQLQIQHIVGPNGLMEAFIKKYSDVCLVGTNVFTLSVAGGCLTGTNTSRSTGKLTLSNPVITSINLQVQAQNMIIGSGITAMFVALTISAGK